MGHKVFEKETIGKDTYQLVAVYSVVKNGQYLSGESSIASASALYSLHIKDAKARAEKSKVKESNAECVVTEGKTFRVKGKTTDRVLDNIKTLFSMHKQHYKIGSFEVINPLEVVVHLVRK